MGAFSDNLTAVAAKLLLDKGQSVTFTREAEGVYDPATSTTGAPTITVYSGNAHPSKYSTFERRAEFIEQDDIKLILEKTTTEPEVGDTGVVSGLTYRVMMVTQTVAQGEDIIYTLQMRAR
jgi:hypothetical protein